VLGTTVDAVFTSEDYGDGFAEVLGDYFRVHAGTQQRVRHVSIDQPRRAVPVRGTDVRRDPDAHRQLVAPVVYADLVRRVVLFGGESSGKTTLAEALAKHFDTAWVPEYGRELWEQRKGRLQADDMVLIGRRQVAEERRLGQGARRWLFCDTSPLTTAFYSQDMFGIVDPALELLASRPYDHIVVCAPDFDFVQDGTRRDARFRLRQHDWYLRELQDRGLACWVVAGSLEERVLAVAARLEQAS
jgi:HTH-type transcriptional repressor of NAD biosynthesis genes